MFASFTQNKGEQLHHICPITQVLYVIYHILEIEYD